MNKKAYQKPHLALIDIITDGHFATSIDVRKDENVDTSDKSKFGIYESSPWEEQE